jgi:hypothetical protein
MDPGAALQINVAAPPPHAGVRLDIPAFLK